jgi:hypothetical protein
MPVPAIAWGTIEITAAIMTAYEIYDLGNTLYEDAGEFNGNLEKAKELLREKIQSIKDEIEKNIDEVAERALLHFLTQSDVKKQSEKTKNATGRIGDGSLEIITAIKQRIPFREVIGMVCEQANKTPIFSLRKKKGVKLSDLPKAKKEILTRLLSYTAEELDLMDDLDSFIMVRLKQLVASFIFEFMDNMLDWASPLKAEVCFGPKPMFEDPPLAAGTQLYRAGTPLNPFFPMSIRRRSAFSADLAIPDYRKKPLTKGNLFAIIEIKFERDTIKKEQFERYDELAKAVARTKNGLVTPPRTNGGTGVVKGCLVALFRYPEDVAIKTQEKVDQKSKPDGKSKTDDGKSKKKNKSAKPFQKGKK